MILQWNLQKKKTTVLEFLFTFMILFERSISSFKYVNPKTVLTAVYLFLKAHARRVN